MNFKTGFTLIAATCCLNQANADSSYDITGVISSAQMDKIVATLLRDAPSGSKATDVNYRGFFTVSPERYLTVVDMNSVQYKVTAKVGIIPLSSTVTMSIAAAFPDLNCNNPVITRLSVTGTNFLLDGEIKNYMTKNAVSIIRDNYVAQSDLIKYCKVKPQI